MESVIFIWPVAGKINCDPDRFAETRVSFLVNTTVAFSNAFSDVPRIEISEPNQTF